LLKLEWDGVSERITLGKKEWLGFQNYNKAAEWVYDVLDANDIQIEGSTRGRNYDVEIDTPWDVTPDTVVQTKKVVPLTKHQWNKAVGDALGCSYSVLFKSFKKLMFKVFIGDDKYILKHIDHWNFRNGWNIHSAHKLARNREKLRETYKDGLYNLLPFVAQFGLTPAELRSEFKKAGKLSEWKIVAKNSIAKNKMLVAGWTNIDLMLAGVKMNTPSTLLKTVGNMSSKYSDYLITNFKGKWKDKKLVWDQIILFRDTQIMAREFDMPFDPKWTPRRMKEEHDKLVKIDHDRKYSPEPMDAVKDIQPERLEHNGFVATLLKNAREIGDEGSCMNHCVGMYSRYVQAGIYLVYSVTKNGERTSTIGIIRDSKDEPWKIQQQYARFNRPVEDLDEKAIAGMIETQLNGAPHELDLRTTDPAEEALHVLA